MPGSLEEMDLGTEARDRRAEVGTDIKMSPF